MTGDDYHSSMGVDKDRLGLARLTAVVQSEVQAVFTPHKPIDDIDMLKGRETELASLLEVVTESGLHGFLVGERGVGKSSLANTAVSLISQQRIFRHQSTQDCQFGDMIAGPLRELCGIDVTLTSRTGESASTFDGKVGLGPLGAGASQKHTSGAVYGSPRITASSAATSLGPHRSILVIDEADAIADSNTKRRLAEFVKALSDTNSNFKVIVVGIARTASELIDHHPSAHRAIKEITVERMADRGLGAIIDNGQQALPLQFEPSVRSVIIKLSYGYPYFTHLIAGEAAKSALVRARSSPNPTGVVVEADLRQALRVAASSAEGTLQEHYNRATRENSNENCRRILFSAAEIVSDRGITTTLSFRTDELREHHLTRFGIELTPGSLGGHMRKLAPSADAELKGIFERVSHGVYRFRDLRMVSYVSILDETERIALSADS